MKLAVRNFIKSLFPNTSYSVVLKKPLAIIRKGKHRIHIVITDQKIHVIDRIDDKVSFSMTMTGLMEFQDRIETVTKPILEGNAGNSKSLNHALRFVKMATPDDAITWIKRQHEFYLGDTNVAKKENRKLPIISVTTYINSYDIMVDPPRKKLILQLDGESYSFPIKSRKDKAVFRRIMKKICPSTAK